MDTPATRSLQPPLGPNSTGTHQQGGGDHQLQEIHRWLQKILNHIWTNLYQAWKLRNTDLHGLDAACAAHLDYMDKRLFEIPLVDRLLAKSREQAAWINIVTPTVHQAKAETVHLLGHNQRDIREFLICPAQHIPRPHTVQIDEL
jgi:hypothetical protein